MNKCIKLVHYISIQLLFHADEHKISAQQKADGRYLPLFNHLVMGLFDIFKKPPILHDDFFGTLRVMEFKDASKNYFEGKGYFAPTNSKTEYLIEADKAVPTEDQKQFYRDLQTNFMQYIEKIKPLIENEFRKLKEGFKINDFTKEFELVCITIPRFDRQALHWDMAFTTIHDLNHHVTIDFVGDQPNGILIDG